MTKTYRGRSVLELLPQIEAELGPDAVIVRQREGLTGGIAGFFQKACVELEARAGGPTPAGAPQFDAYDEAGFADHLDAAEALAAQQSQPGAAPAHRPVVVPNVVPDRLANDARPPADVSAPPAGEPLAGLAALFAPDRASAPVPAVAAPAAPAAPEAAPLPASPGRSAVPSTTSGAWPAAGFALHDAMAERGLSPALAEAVIEETVANLLPFSAEDQLKPLVADALARRIPVQPLRKPGGAVVGFVGSGGSGKTQCVARLATTYATRSKTPVACIALRPKDGGAELAQLLAPAGVPMHAAPTAKEARQRIEALDAETLVLVDTPGVSPRAEAELRVLARELRQMQLDEVHLAVPATSGPRQARQLVEGTRSLRVNCLAITHADETDQLGTVVGLAIDTEMPLSYIGRGTIVSGGLRPAAADQIAEALLA